MSYVLSLTALVMMTLPSLLKGKNMKLILFLLCFGNALVAVSYFIDGSINGAAASLIGVVCTLINFVLEMNGKPVPKWLIVTYIAISVVTNLVVSGGIDLNMLIVVGAGLAYQIGVTRKNGKDYRLWILFNLTLWCVYDAASGSYGVIVTHLIQLVTNVAGMLIYDRGEK